MFRIPSFYQETVDFKTAWNTITNFGRGDALEGMNAMNRVWEEHCASDDYDDDAFWEMYAYEVNAYNVVFTNMNKLLGEAA
mgnify:CR=1 FL=1|tara:strand:+ start:1644 stop:1886 length:243 start_codon:yes stop_codon:yes gene_type:complete